MDRNDDFFRLFLWPQWRPCQSGKIWCCIYFVQLWGVTVRLHITSPGPGNTSCMYSAHYEPLISSDNLTLSNFPLYYSTILTSTFATVSTDIPSYEAIHGHMPLHNYCSVTADTFDQLDVMNYPFPTRQDTQLTSAISSTFESTDWISEVSWDVYRIEVNGSRKDLVRISEANPPEMHCDTWEQQIVRFGQRKIADGKMLDKYTQLRLTDGESIASQFKRPTGQ
jgi:hypothetical protein